MRLLQRPSAPPRFTTSATGHRRAIAKIVGDGGHPTSDDFVDNWSHFKHVLVEAQSGRCGYCETFVLAGDHGTIDHYRPKAAVHALHDDPESWGVQPRHSASVFGRRQQTVSDRGYHWLAYDWGNYVFACSCCNEGWKRAFFPVATHPRRCPPIEGDAEEGLVLHCYHSERPSEHIRFIDDGSVEALTTTYGFETIRTLGLNRAALRQERASVAADVFELIREYVRADKDVTRRVALTRLQKLGGDDRPFPGVVRAIVEQELETSWEAFLSMVAFLPVLE